MLDAALAALSRRTPRVAGRSDARSAQLARSGDCGSGRVSGRAAVRPSSGSLAAGVPWPELARAPTGSAVKRRRSRPGHGLSVRSFAARSSSCRLSPPMTADPAAAWQACRAPRAAAARGASGGAAAASVMLAARRYAPCELAMGLRPLVGPSHSIWPSWVRATWSRRRVDSGPECHRNRSTYRSYG